MIHELPRPRLSNPPEPRGMCEHRTVSKEGRIICGKIVEGDNAVSPNTCRNCPFIAANCAHLRFSLQQTSPSPLIVRYNGRTEIWDDDPPEIRFHQAACAARVMPIDDPRVCAACALREAKSERSPTHRPAPRRLEPAARGKVVPFPQADPMVAGA